MLPYRGDAEPLGDLIRRRRQRLGLSQADVAEAVGVFDRPTVTRQEVARWERGKRIPRGRTRKALALALDLPLRQLDLAAAAERLRRAGETVAANVAHPAAPHLRDQETAVHAIRAALLDHGVSMAGLARAAADEPPPDLTELRSEVADVMAAYQASRYRDMLGRLPEVLSGAHIAVASSSGRRNHDAQGVLALASQAAAMVLTKLGELDLAWTAADRGLSAAEQSGDEAIHGSLSRSVVHTLQSHGRAQVAARLTEATADSLRSQVTPVSDRVASVYGTLLLAGAMAAARGGDRHATDAYLDEAKHLANRLGHDTNLLWTAFGPTNVAIHRVASSVALGDMGDAHRHIHSIDARRLPLERRVRYAFDLARVLTEHKRFDEAVDAMLAAEHLAPEQVHHHVMGRQIIADLRRLPGGKRNSQLAQLARRVEDAEIVTVGSPG